LERPVIHRRPLGKPWQEELRLEDGRTLWLRPISPADAEPLRSCFSLLTPEEVRMRFLHPLTELSPEMAKRLTHIHPRMEFAQVAAEKDPPGEALIGAVVRASIDAGTRRADFAILVSRFLAQQGLGTLLMKQMLRWAKLKRLEAVYGDVLQENTAMLQLATHLGFRRKHADEPGLVRIEKIL
jgi:RimJ/RimL family protein N-acetyltransferase